MSEPQQPLGVVLVGYDGAGTQNHQLDMYEPAFADHPRFAIRGVTDLGASDDRVELSRRRAEALAVPYIEDPRVAISRPDVDLVGACVGFDHRVGLVQMAADEGKHVFIDKPMALTLQEVEAISELVSAAGVLCVPAHHLRYKDPIRRATEALAQGTIGTLESVHADFIVTSGATRAAAENPEVWPLGELMNFVVYPVDSIRAMTGLEVVRVHATRGGFFYGGADDEDFGVLSLTLEGGVIATVTVGRAPVAGHLDGLTHRYRIVGSGGDLLVDANNPAAIVHGGGRSRRIPFVTQADSVTVLLDHVADAIAGDGPVPVGPGDARESLAVTLAARRAADTGAVVYL